MSPPSQPTRHAGPAWLPPVVQFVKKAAIGGGILILGLQFVPPDLFIPSLEGSVIGKNPETTFQIPAPPEVEAILRRSCYDCHSNETHWPLYSRIAPMSWLVLADVKNGRGALNFSEWGDYDADDMAVDKESCWNAIKAGDMPPWFYYPPHPDAIMSTQDKKVLEGWLMAPAEAAADEKAADEKAADEKAADEKAADEKADADKPAAKDDDSDEKPAGEDAKGADAEKEGKAEDSDE